jgi:hypothetical protein
VKPQKKARSTSSASAGSNLARSARASPSRSTSSAREAEVGLVQKGRRVQGDRAAGARDVGAGEAVQLVIEQGEERLARLGVAALGALEDLLQGGGRFAAHRPPC